MIVRCKLCIKCTNIIGYANDLLFIALFWLVCWFAARLIKLINATTDSSNLKYFSVWGDTATGGDEPVRLFDSMKEAAKALCGLHYI